MPEETALERTTMTTLSEAGRARERRGGDDATEGHQADDSVVDSIVDSGGHETAPEQTNATDEMPAHVSPGTSAKALLNTTLALSERQEMIRIISNRLFVALFALMAITMAGAYVTYGGHAISAGATNWMVLLCGAIGGFISLQRRLKTMTGDDLLLLARSWVYVLLSPLVGGILALLLYFLFIGELLDGDLFPNFETSEVPEGGAEASSANFQSGVSVLFAVEGIHYTDYAKLIFWCFLAGYSESFVTNIISRFESTTDDKPVDPS